MFIAASTQFHLPPRLLSSLCRAESNHNVRAINKDDGDGDSIGICQIKLTTAKDMGFRGSEQELYDPKTNIFYAAKYLRRQIRTCGTIFGGVEAYNLGHCGPNSRYLKRVKRFYGDL